MAGQRSYWSGSVTNTRGPVEISAKVTCGGAATSWTVVTGDGVTVAHTAGSNDAIVTFPEKFGKCVRLRAEYVPAGSSDASTVAKVGTDYSSTTGQATFVMGARAATNTGFTALNDATGTLYIDAKFQLGM